MRIRLLGGFGVSVGNRTIEEGAWRLRKAASLVKLLALSPNHSLHREQIMDVLWPELGTARASNNLRQVLHAARRTLEPGRAAKSRYLGLREHQQLVLCPDERVWVDVEAFEEAAATARRGRDPAAYGLAIDLYAGELLPGDRYEEWAEGRRQGLRRLYLALLVEFAGLHEERDEHDAAIEMLLRAAAEDPALEEAHAGLMRVYALSGKRTLALDQYEQLRQVLSEKLGIKPDASTGRLHDEIAAGRFRSGEPTAFETRNLLVEGKHNLPARRSSFVGRENELRDLKRDLAMTRLLTLTGTGGCGKTRLALEAARDLVGAYPDGVWLVELAPVSESALVPKAVATALGMQEQPERPLTDALVDFLRAKRALLVLDNCEHLLDAVARLADVLLNSCAHLKVLATSRESPNVEGELNWSVPSLSAPSRELPPTVEELAGYESVRLFVERARHRNPAFALTPANADAVARICGRLEGIPLAIELAAARVGLSAEEIAARLGDSLGLLITGSRTASPRQRTLRGTLDWSHELLSEHERKIFARLSVFAGGWTLEAAEAVGAGVDTDQSVVFDSLSGLVEKSLVVAEATGRGVRYRLLEPVRQYALEKLEESGEVEAAKRPHARYFLALSEEAEPELFGPQDVEWLGCLEEEHDNMRAALSWASDLAEPELVLRLSAALQPFWEAHGHFAEGRRWLEEALKKGEHASDALRAKALHAVCRMALAQNDSHRTEILAREGIGLCAELKITSWIAASFRRMRAYAVRVRGEYERAKQLAEEGLTLSKEANDKPRTADALLELGVDSYSLGDLERGKRHLEEGIAVCREIGYNWRLGDILNSLGYLLLLEAEYERAVALIEESVDLYRARGIKGNLEYALDSLGWAALLSGQHERARASYRECLTLCKELGNSLVASASLEGLACTFARGEAEQAVRLFGAAQALREEGEYHNTPEEAALREPYLAAARAGLDGAVWQEAYAAGKRMALEEAVEYALYVSEGIPSAYAMLVQPPASTRAVVLTRREEEIAALVARGTTNRQIASELVLSQHTVDKHVKNILKKLGIHSREQVASRLRDL